LVLVSLVLCYAVAFAFVNLSFLLPGSERVAIAVRALWHSFSGPFVRCSVHQGEGV